MGEEEKKAEEQKVEEKKTEEEPKKTEENKKEEEAKTEEKQSDDKKTEESSKEVEAVPQYIILRVYMHCEGCARKVRRCLKGFEGVEDVVTDCKSHKVVVKGEKADPLKVVARVQSKSHRQVELLSPVPPPPEDSKKPVEKDIPKQPEEKQEAQVITVVLKVHMHCEACAQEIKKRIMRMKGVESVDPDLKASLVTVKGVFEASKLVEYVYKRTGKHAVIVKQEPQPENKEDEKGKEVKNGEENDEKKGDEVVADGGEAVDEKKEGGGGGGEEAVKQEDLVTAEEEETNVVEVKKNDFYYYYPPNYQIYPPQFATEMYSYSYPPPAPQMFSDENPNACTVM